MKLRSITTNGRKNSKYKQQQTLLKKFEISGIRKIQSFKISQMRDKCLVTVDVEVRNFWKIRLTLFVPRFFHADMTGGALIGHTPQNFCRLTAIILQVLFLVCFIFL